MRSRGRQWSVVLVALFACAPDRSIDVDPGSDAGTHAIDDGGGFDSGWSDAGLHDDGGTSLDAGRDGGEDAGRFDAGSSDAGCVSPRGFCSGVCTDLPNDPAHCGDCLNRCGEGQQCFGGICGTSVCGTCGPTEYCETGTRTCRTGCSQNADCPQPGSCVNHACTCGADYHACGDTCVSDFSTQTCGTSCSACFWPWGGEPTCDGQGCGFTCDSGYHVCDSTCASDEDAQTCGQRCTPCAGPGSNGYPTCVSGSCGVGCYSGFATCGGACIPESVSQCGTSCRSCPTPGVAHAVADCIAGTCSYQCTAPYVKTANGCELAVAVFAGYYQTCAKTQSGAIPCWGSGTDSLPSGATSISLGSLNCYIASGQLKCGGSTVSVSGVTFNQVSVGDGHICAVTTGGALYCWGSNTFGELGDGTKTYRSAPTLINVGGSVSKVAAGGSHTCAVLSGGSVKCWGYNYYGQVGNRDTARAPEDQPSPVAVGSLSNVSDISAGDSHTCAISGGALYCWGKNTWGDIAQPDSQCESVFNASFYWDHCPAPVAVTQMASGVTVVATGNSNTCAVKDGAVWCWGYNDSGEIGTGSHGHYGVYTPYRVIASDAIGVTTTTAGYYACAVLSTGAIWCWGANSSGQLGDGTTTQRDAPVQCTGR